MRKRKGLKEVVPGYENVSFHRHPSPFILTTSANFFLYSTTTSCKNAHDRPACVWQSRVESFFMKLMNAIQLPRFKQKFHSHFNVGLLHSHCRL
jgi:hypothetical protein